MATNEQRNVALVGLAATDPPDAGPCRTDDELAAFGENRLDADQRDAVAAHLAACDRCRHHWMQAAPYLASDAPTQVEQTDSSRGALAESVYTLVHWLANGWRITVPVAASLLVGVFVLTNPGDDGPANAAPMLAEMVDARYAAATDETAAAVERLRLPWDSQAMAFAQTEPSIQSRAFSAGLVTGAARLAGDTPQIPVALTPPGSRWNDSAYAAHYEFGRLVVALWAETSAGRYESAAQYRAVAEALLPAIAGSPGDSTAAVEALRSIQAALVSLDAGAPPNGVSELRRRLEVTMNRLAV